MNITFWGTRGSLPVAQATMEKYGGNTTCIEVDSECLPDGIYLVVDTGSGVRPFGERTLIKGIRKLIVLQTHYHHDHTQGWPMCPFAYIKQVPVHFLGPIEDGVGPKQMLETIMKPPLFPVDFVRVASHITCKGLKNPSSQVIVLHSEGGMKLLTVEELEQLEQREPPQLRIGHNGYYDIQECLVVRMLYTHHPERTISYRFEERPTGKVGVILTDHENLAGIPHELFSHLSGADLLVMDSQYTRQMYENRTAGFGHATPDYCAKTAAQVQAKKLGLTHHDPSSDDKTVDSILQTARDVAAQTGYTGKIFACRDYQTEEV